MTKRQIKKPWLVLSLILLGTFLLVFQAAEALACEIEVKVYGEPQAVYKVGDEVILKVSVFLSHRNCPEGIEATQFKAEGLEVLGATQWTETSDNHFERLVKVKITSTEDGEASLHAKRTCSKEGGYSFIALKVVSA